MAHPRMLTLIWFCFRTVLSYQVRDSHDAMMYLNRFGYLQDEEMPLQSDMSMSSMRPMLLEFQGMFNIPQTGVLDLTTLHMMNAPRCGNLDVYHGGHHSMYLNDIGLGIRETGGRSKRYGLLGPTWNSRELTWKVTTFSANMRNEVNRETVLQVMHQAFTLWSDVTNLDFIHRPNDNRVDIEMHFVKGRHPQDSNPFDGVGTVLAHAYPPGRGLLGDVHYDDSETWTVNTTRGFNLLEVATHEIGHALGLAHSNVVDSIMYMTYRGYRHRPNLQLHSDDIEGIRFLYGIRNRSQNTPALVPTTAPTVPSIMTPATTPATSIPNLCADSRIDAITALRDGSVFAFKGNYVFQISSSGSGILPGWPRTINSTFPGIEGNIDAVVTRSNGKTYFFKGPDYWRFTGHQRDDGYPKKISLRFRRIPDNVDSAFERQRGFYFTKGDKIWRFNLFPIPFVSGKYPVPLERWNLGPNIRRVDASFTAPNGHIYLFSNQSYWRINARTLRVDKLLREPYPRNTGYWWFGCRNQTTLNDQQYRRTRKPYLYPDNYLDDYARSYYDMK